MTDVQKRKPKTFVYDALSRLVAVEDDTTLKADCVRFLSWSLLITRMLPDGTIERIDPRKFYIHGDESDEKA